jgi:hypothetical protein
MLKTEWPKLVKATSIALALYVGIIGLSGLRGLSAGSVEACYGDFIQVCHPIEPPALMRWLLAVGMIAAFWVLVRIGSKRKPENN